MLARHPLCLVSRGCEVIVLGSGDRRDTGIADQRHEPGESGGVQSLELVAGGSEPRGCGEELGKFGAGVW